MIIKRGQVTIFLVIAILLIIGVASFFYIKSDFRYFNQPIIKPQIESIRGAVLGCASETAQDSLDIIGIQGGYYNPPENYFDFVWSFIPYYHKEGSFFVPSKDRIESELAEYFDENIGYCLDTLVFEGFSLTYSPSKTSVSINPESVLFSSDLDFNIEKEGNTIVIGLKRNPISEESKLSDMLEVSEYFIDSYKEDPENICLSCLTELAVKKNLYIDLVPFDNSSTLTVISQNSTTHPDLFEFLS